MANRKDVKKFGDRFDDIQAKQVIDMINSGGLLASDDADRGSQRWLQDILDGKPQPKIGETIVINTTSVNPDDAPKTQGGSYAGTEKRRGSVVIVKENEGDGVETPRKNGGAAQAR